MKLENEHVVSVQTSPRKSYNPFDSDDEDTNDKSNNITGYDIKSFETSPDSLTFHLDSSNFSWEEAILGHSRVLSNSISSDTTTNEEVVYTELFTDKKITECELPELVFSYKDNGFNSVKDIGIDEGVPIHDKVWIESHDSNNMSTVLAFNDDFNGEKGPFVQNTTKDSMKGNELVHEVLERPYSADKCGTDDLLKTEEFEHNLSKKQEESDFSWQAENVVESDGVVNDKKDPQQQVGEKDEEKCRKMEMTENGVSEEKEHCKDSVPVEHVELSVVDEEEASMQSNVEISSIMHQVEATVESNESQSEEVSSSSSVQSISNALSYNSKVESGSIILDFNGASATISDKEKEKEDISEKNEADEKPPVAQTMSRDDDVGSSILDCGTDKRVHGETSFSAAMPPPASITYMGPNSHAGNVSLRSESSAGSTRSFAFPVMQAEWNTSPVRMAKADQRHFSKQRGWVQAIVCCKF
ncbi:uncharacterized protein [Spinacia oleracea]|uniref:Protein WAVE n=1 Tax=Spinacia oleracea TaxID=3562 RepID=A0A9R0JLD0_SPIOL|nr:uncharacterized protein LOC110778650 [Spinacia oleracea]